MAYACGMKMNMSTDESDEKKKSKKKDETRRKAKTMQDDRDADRLRDHRHFRPSLHLWCRPYCRPPLLSSQPRSAFGLFDGIRRLAKLLAPALVDF